jgi:RNA polymerase sigma-70 factor (ECF subfamily)
LDTRLSYTEKELFALVAAGDEQAFRLLLARHQPFIFGQAMGYLKDVQKAEDIVQEVFLSLWKNRHRIKDMESPQGYLVMTARNRIVDEFRKKLMLPLVDEMAHLYTAPGMLSDEKLETKQLLAIIQSAIDQLPPQRKRIFEMSKKEGRKYQEIAAILGISKETVKVQMVKALAFLRSAVQHQVSILLLFSLFS